MSNIQVKKRDGNLEKLDFNKINKSAERATNGFKNVSASEIVLDASLGLFDGISTIDIDKALILSARAKIEREPEYSYVAASLLLNSLYKEVFGAGVDDELFEEQYRQAFIENIYQLVELGRLNPSCLDVDLEFLSKKLVIERDRKFKYLGLQTLYDRYFLHEQGRRLETPQAFFMRVAIGLCFNEEKDREKRIVEFYDVISQFLYMPSTPTLFNSATTYSQLSSCYLSTVDDSEDGIMGTWHDQARLSKYAGGLGIDANNIRGTNADIKGTNGKSSGPVPFLKILNDVLNAFNQSGKRKGAGCVYFEPWHIDFEDILDLRKKTGDERRRCHDMNTAAWCPDLFFEKVLKEEEWYMFSPDETPDLHSLYGEDFNKRYKHYVKKAKSGKMKLFKVVEAKNLFKKILVSLFETGHPWICFKDASNICYSNKNAGVINSSNLCTEILRHTIATLYKMGQKSKVGETAVCNLGSVNYKEHLVYDEETDTYTLDKKKLAKTVATAIRMLDNVIDLNFYPIEEARKSNFAHRPIGLGTMGLTDVFNAMGINYDCQEAIDLSSELQELVSYNAIKTSVDLAKERGPFSSYEDSEWSKGNFPQDMFQQLHEYRGTEANVPDNKISDRTWNNLRIKMLTHGIRNASLLAIAPTATISYICGCGQSIEPDYALLYSYDTLSGSFTMINEWFVKEAKKRGIWCEELLTAIKQVDGDITKINVSDDLKKQFKTAFDLDYRYLIDCAAARQQWIDMGQSFNIYSDKTSLKYNADIYLYCYKRGLKTTYYFRGRAASKVEKSTVEAVKEPSTCSIEAMKRGEICESCQ
jgi:ribonucleoside-diphosphate reductase alpha chain